MLILDAAATRALLPYGSVAEAIDAMLARRRAREAFAPVRTVVELPGGGVFLLMPASDATFASVKLVTVHAGNTDRGLPSVQGDVLLLSTATGERLLLLEGTTLTARRTAAVSLLAAQKLLPRPFGKMLVVGTGAQAAAHAHAFWESGQVKEIQVAGERPADADRMVRDLVAQGIRALPVVRLDSAVGQVQVVVTATTSRTPVIPDAAAPGALVIGMGSYRPEMAELPASLVRRSRLFVDTLEGARAEAGDLLQAGVDWSQVTPLEEIGQRPSPDGRPLVFKSVGDALWDLAAAEMAHQRCSQDSAGRSQLGQRGAPCY
jgi:1-piperideine-2-carboxylate/1-pyrroline-2-carboxylate reductase [NAD(P)H]